MKIDDMTTMEPGTALTAPVPTDLQGLFQRPDGIKAELARIKAKAIDAAKGLDVSKAKDRDTIRSVAFQVAKRRKALVDAGKAMNEERVALNNAVYAECRVITAELDKTADELRAPVAAWEAAEDARVAAILARLNGSFKSPVAATTSADLAAELAKVSAVVMDASWAEFLGDAEVAKIQRVEALNRAIATAVDAETAAAELVRLRAEVAARDEDERVAREAAAIEAAEQQRKANEADDARRKAEADAADLRRQLDEANTRAAREAQEARDRAAQAALIEEARVAREIADAEQAKADEAERLRQAKIDADMKAAAEKQAILDAAARVQAVADHKADIRAAIIAALSAMAGRASPEAIADAIIGGDIPHVHVVM